jgi:hypothetical protein
VIFYVKSQHFFDVYFVVFHTLYLLKLIASELTSARARIGGAGRARGQRERGSVAQAEREGDEGEGRSTS